MQLIICAFKMSLSARMVFLPTERGNLNYQCGMWNPTPQLLPIQKCKVPTTLSIIHSGTNSGFQFAKFLASQNHLFYPATQR